MTIRLAHSNGESHCLGEGLHAEFGKLMKITLNSSTDGFCMLLSLFADLTYCGG
jgi:hypothetical protein